MSAASKVYFIRTSESDSVDIVKAKLEKLIAGSRVLDPVAKKGSVAVKLHFGEEGNVGHVDAAYAGVVCRDIAKCGGSPFITDTNTLYRGRRTNSKEHLKLAREHGFTKEACAAEIVIPDDTKKENVSEVKIDGRFFKTGKIPSVFFKSDALVGLAHFKGHIMTGFGGALKNIGMGCASREGKLAQHSDVTPVVVVERCVACKACIKACPADAIFLKDNKAVIDPAKCIGCATCIAVCAQNAIEVNWESGGSNIQEKMVEYAAAVLLKKKGKLSFINFATKITKECDCLAKDDPRIVPDIGIFASTDPVSIDKACYDACAKAAGKDVFREAHPNRDGSKQLKCAQALGLGSLDYELIEL